MNKKSNPSTRRGFSFRIAVLIAGSVLLAANPGFARWGGGGGGWGGRGGGGFGGEVDGVMAVAAGAAGADGHGGGFGGDGFGGGNVGHADSYSGGESSNHIEHLAEHLVCHQAVGLQHLQRKPGGAEAGPVQRNNSLQESHENTEKHMQYQTDSTINNNVGNTNWNGGDGGNPYYCCGGGGGYSSGDVAGAAALGAVGGMAVGMMAGSAMSQPSTTTIIDNPAPAPYYGAPAPQYGAPVIGSTVPYLPPSSTAYAYGATFYYSNGTSTSLMGLGTKS